MGQQLAIEIGEEVPLHVVVDRAAAHYIITQNETDIEQFTQEDFCKDVELLVTDILSRNVSDLDTQLISQRINKGEKLVDITQAIPCAVGSEADQSDREAIARFYVSIAHLYAVLAKASGAPNVPKREVNVDDIEPGLQRIKDIIHVQLRNVQLAKAVYQLEEKIEHRKSGLPDLEPLYFDVYDPSAQLYTQMSDAAKIQFEDDIRNFYVGFADEEIPSDVSTYADITLSKCCQSRDRESTELFEKYGHSLADIITSSKKAHSEIYPIMDQILIEVDGTVTVQPDLNVEQLDALMQNARETIVGEYMENERKYLKGLEMFEAIVEHQLGRTMQNQLANLNNQLYILVSQ